MKNSSRVAERNAKEILSNWKEKCAFVCASDRIALGVIRAAQSLQLQIPDQVVVTGFDGVFLDRISSPHITTIRQPVVEMGEACARMLLKKFRKMARHKGNGFLNLNCSCVRQQFMYRAASETGYFLFSIIKAMSDKGGR